MPHVLHAEQSEAVKKKGNNVKNKSMRCYVFSLRANRTIMKSLAQHPIFDISAGLQIPILACISHNPVAWTEDCLWTAIAQFSLKTFHWFKRLGNLQFSLPAAQKWGNKTDFKILELEPGIFIIQKLGIIFYRLAAHSIFCIRIQSVLKTIHSLTLCFNLMYWVKWVHMFCPSF